MSEPDPKPLMDALKSQRNAALDTIAEMYATITVLQKRIAELEKPDDPPAAA